MYTGQKQLNEPTRCSDLIDKMRWKYCKGSSDHQPNTKKKKLKLENGTRGVNDNTLITDINKQEPKNNIKALTRKIKRLTAVLPKVLTFREAYEEGQDKCQTCEIQKEEFKQIMQNVKVIEILIDGVIEKEQAELLEKENELVEKNPHHEKGSMGDSNNSTKITCKFDIYGGEIVIKHNLKCILIKLQKTIGDILVQIGFVKTRGLAKEDRYKAFDLSLDELKQLKFEFTSLTDKIIQLLKKTPDKKSNGDVCTFCVKEKLTKYNEILLEILKRGRNLKVVMRNDQLETTDQCCPRSYPHIHAQVHGKPLVLKYSLPFVIQDHPAVGTPIRESIDAQDESAELGRGNTVGDEGLDKNGATAMDERQKVVPSQVFLEKRQDGSITSGSIASSQMEDELGGIYGNKESPHYMKENSSDFSENIPSTQNTYSENNHNDSIRENSDESMFNSENLQKSGPTIGKPGQVEDSKEKDQNDKRNVSVPGQSGHKINPSSKYTGDDYNDDDYSFSDDSDKLTILKREPEQAERNVSYTRSRGSQSSKKVSFYDEDAKTVLPLAISSSKTAFMQLNNVDYSPNITIPENDSGMDKTPFGDKIINVATYPAAIDSFILNKQRKKSEKVENKIVDFFEDKPLASAYKSFVLPEYEIHDTLVCQSVEEKSNQSHPKDINHQDKNIEHLLKLLGKEKLISVTTPAKCCKVNNFLAEYDSSTNLPLSASLYSLPLDHSDLRYLAQVAGRHISSENLWLEPDEEVPVKEYEWETRVPASGTDQTKWQRAFGGTEKKSDQSIKSEETSQIKWTKVRSASSREELKVLPTIDEEEPYVDKTIFNMPYVPSIPSLPLSEEEKNSLLGKRMKPRGKICKTMELRYFTVEFENEVFKSKSLEEKYNTIKQIKPGSGGSNDDCNMQVNNNKVDLNSLKFEKNKQHSVESFHSCCPSADIINQNSPTITEGNKHSAVDEMIMMNAIYLGSDTIATAIHLQNNCIKPIKFSNLSLCSQNLKNNYSYPSVNINKAEECKETLNISKEYTHLWHDQVIPKRSHNMSKKSRTEHVFYMKSPKDLIKKPSLTYQNNLKEQRCCAKIFKEGNNYSEKNVGQPKISTNQKGYYSKLNIQNKNIQNHINHKKLKKSELCVKKHKELKRKPFIPKKSSLIYRRMEGKANMPPLRFTQLRPVLARERIPSVVYKTKNAVLEMYSNFKDKASSIKTSFHTIPKNSHQDINKEKADSQQLKFGFQKEYISVKKNLIQQYKSSDLLFKPKQSPIAQLKYKIPKIISRTKLCNIGGSNLTSLVNKSSCTISTELNHSNLFSKQSPLNITKVSSTQSFVSNTLEIHDLFKETEKCHPFYLYDGDGLPLTDNSGRPLRNLNGDLLMICNDAGIPISDANIRPIYDAFGHSLYSTEFTPKKRSCADILRSLTTSSGEPMLFYDVEGRPLTSVSGTILVDSSGNCLIKFGSTGNPVSDSKGRPIFDVQGETCYRVANLP